MKHRYFLNNFHRNNHVDNNMIDMFFQQVLVRCSWYSNYRNTRSNKYYILETITFKMSKFSVFLIIYFNLYMNTYSEIEGGTTSLDASVPIC